MSEHAGGPELRVLPSADDVAEAAATEIAHRLAEAIDARGVAHWVVTGGSAAPGIYHHLARPPLRDLVDWSKVHAWWGDDRYVPPDHPLSNVLPFTQILLTSGGDEEGGSPESADVGGHGDGVRIPATQIHQVPTTEAIAHAGGAAWAATGYANAIREHGPAVDGAGSGSAGLPAFDVFVAGVGPDGHILSVFPGSAAWDATALCVGVPAPTHIEPHVDRVTMHPSLVAAAHRIVVVCTGESKATVLGRAWTGGDARELPVRAAWVDHATWILDDAAAASLPRP